MFRDESFPGGSHSSPPPRESSPPQSPHYDNNANNFDDIFGSAPSSPSLLPSSASHGNTEPSDIPRLRSTHSTAGYRDGLTASKGTTIQEGFDEGFGLGATMGLRVGAILGILEGIWSAVAKSEKAVASGKPASTGADLDLGAEKTTQNEGERLRGLVIKARNALRTENVFGTEYWGSDGIWKYDVKEGDNGWNDVVDAHPLIQAWEATVKTEVDHVKLDTAVLERTDVKRLGESE